MSKSRKKSSHDSHDPTRGVDRSGWWPTTHVDAAEPTAMEAGVHHGRGTKPADAGDRVREEIRRQAAISAHWRRAGYQLLRGGPRWVLDPPISHEPGGRESGGGLIEHRSESTRPARQDRSDGRGEA